MTGIVERLRRFVLRLGLDVQIRPRSAYFGTSRRLGPIAATFEGASLAILADGFPLVTLFLARAASVTASLRAVAEVSFSFLRVGAVSSLCVSSLWSVLL